MVAAGHLRGRRNLLSLSRPHVEPEISGQKSEVREQRSEVIVKCKVPKQSEVRNQNLCLSSDP